MNVWLPDSLLFYQRADLRAPFIFAWLACLAEFASICPLLLYFVHVLMYSLGGGLLISSSITKGLTPRRQLVKLPFKNLKKLPNPTNSKCKSLQVVFTYLSGV